jgi:hypothetical protein
MKPSRTYDLAKRGQILMLIVTGVCLALTGWGIYVGSSAVGALATMSGIAIGALGTVAGGGALAMGVRTGWLGVKGSSDATPYDKDSRAP